jgi:hypothetical protein
LPVVPGEILIGICSNGEREIKGERAREIETASTQTVDYDPFIKSQLASRD